MDNRKKRILFFIDSLGCGGSEKSLLSLLQLLDYDRLEVDLIVAERGGALLPLLPKEVNVIYYEGSDSIHAKLTHIVYAIRWRWLRLIGKHRHGAEVLWSSTSTSIKKITGRVYDVAIAYNQGFATYYIAEKVKAQKKIAWINTDMRPAGYDEKFNRKFYDKFDHIVDVSGLLHNNLVNSSFADATRLITIYDILNPHLIHQLAEQPIDDMPDEGFKICTVGRLSHPKNYPLAIDTAVLLRDMGIKFTWYIVGNGELYHELKALITAKGLDGIIRLLGVRINPYPYIKNADIYVQTSSFEGFCITLAEAKILGRPIVTTDFEIVHDQITDGVNGLITEMTPESVAHSIIRLINDQSLRQRLIDNVNKEENTSYLTEVRKFYNIIGLKE